LRARAARAFDAGRILWETRLPAAVQGFPLTFTVVTGLGERRSVD